MFQSTKFSSLSFVLFMILHSSRASELGSLIDKSLNAAQDKILHNDISTRGDRWSMVASMRVNDDTSPNEFKHRDMTQGSALDELDWRIKLDNSNRYELEWKVAYESNQIVFAININQTASSFRIGYDVFALGFSSYGQLESSDFCLVWYDLGHRVHLQDAQTDHLGQLKLVEPSESVCKLISKSNHHVPRTLEETHEDSSSGTTSGRKKRRRNYWPATDLNGEKMVRIVFRRPLDVCESRAPYYMIDRGTTHLVWFTMRGPLLSIDGVNLNEMQNRSSGADHHSQPHNHHSADRRIVSNEDEISFESGMKRIQLIANKPELAKSPELVSSSSHGKGLSHDILMEQFAIPAKETTYWCKLFKLPHKFETKRYHITKYEAVITPANDHVVHHMELFNCANLNPSQETQLRQLYESGGWAGDCGGADRPKATEPCRKVVLAWAMGAQPLVYPEQVGQSIGGHGYSPYVILEVHYNNIDSSAGLVDNSGLRFHYTGKLRPYDAGILEVGLEYTDKNSIPPGMVTPLAGHCVSECTRIAMGSGAINNQCQQQQQDEESMGSYRGGDNGDEPESWAISTAGVGTVTSTTTSEVASTRNTNGTGSPSKGSHLEGIYIFAAQLHTHLTGVASWTEQVREGKLVGELQRDDHYSPHFQEIRLLPEPVHVAPGDALIHYCLYDTRKRVNITLGGFATSDEMCVTYLHYYPRIDLEVCKSSVDTSALETYFAYLARDELQKTSEKLSETKQGEGETIGGGDTNRKSVSENYHSIEWSARRSRELIQFYANAPLSVQCNRSNGERFPGYWNGMEPTKLWPESSGNFRLDGESFAAPSASSMGDSGPMSSARYAEDFVSSYRGRNHKRRHAHCSQPDTQESTAHVEVLS